jgi:putative phage-type endonuclease
MKKLVSTLGLEKDKWLRLRKQGIGGSDAGAVCGVNPYATAMSVYKDKTSEEIEDVDNESMRQGRDLEDYVAKRFMEATGLKVRRSNFMYQSEEYPWMLADVDRLIAGQDAGLECKTASAYNADKWKDGEIPPHYLIQCYHYMAVTGIRTWYIAVVILGREFRYARIDWDEDVIRNLVKIEADFWNNHVLAGVLPDPDGSKACDEVLEKYFHISRRDSEISLVGFDDELKRRTELKKLIDKLEKEKNQIDQKVKLYMKDSERAVSEHYKVSWTTVDSSRIDTKRLKADKPDIYNEFLKISSSRRFTVNAA